MDQIVRKHRSLEAADPNVVIVTLFLCTRGFVRGWYFGPPAFRPDVPMSWHTGPQDNLLAPVALVRAMEIARKMDIGFCVVDPDDLWDEMQGFASQRAFRPDGMSA